jgi:hypothetical protein
LGTEHVVDKTSVVNSLMYNSHAYNTVSPHFLNLLRSKVWADFVREVKNQLAAEEILRDPSYADLGGSWDPDGEAASTAAAATAATLTAARGAEEEEEETLEEDVEEEEGEREEDEQEEGEESDYRELQQHLVRKHRHPQQQQHRKESASPTTFRGEGLRSPAEGSGKRKAPSSPLLLPESSPAKKNGKFVFAAPSAPTTLRLTPAAKKSPSAAASAPGSSERRLPTLSGNVRRRPTAAEAAAAAAAAKLRRGSVQTEESSAASDSE